MSAISLSTLQKKLTQALTDPRGHEADLKSLGRILLDAPPLPLSERLEVYSYAYSARLIEALEADFRRTCAALGKRRFRKLAREYLESHPSREWTVSFVGRHLPRFLSSKKSVDRQVVALAHLDWAETEVFFSENESPWDPSSLSSVPGADQGKIRLLLSRSVRILDEREGFQKRARLVWRNGFYVKTQALSAAQTRLIRELEKGRPLSTALTKLSPRAQSQAAFWIQTWAVQGLFRGAEITS